VVIKKNKGGAPPRSYGPFLKLLDALPKPPLPIPAPTAFPDPGTLDLTGFERPAHSVDEFRKVDTNKESRETGTTERDQSYESFNGPLGDFAVPTMEEIGMVATGSIRGGETNAHKVFERFMKDKKRVAAFQKPKTSPGVFDPPSSSFLHLRISNSQRLTFPDFSYSTFTSFEVWYFICSNILSSCPSNQ
jgi:cryptochrome